MRAASSYILYSVFTHSIAAARLLFNLKRLPLLLSCGKSGAIMTNSANETKQAKAVQVVDFNDAFDIYESIETSINSFGGLGYVMELTKNFAYTLSESKVNDNDLPAIKVGKKSFYLNPVGKINQANVLNVIKSVLKVEDAKRVLAKKLAKRLSFNEFCETRALEEKILLLSEGAKLAGVELSKEQKTKAKHRLYDEYLKNLGLDE